MDLIGGVCFVNDGLLLWLLWLETVRGKRSAILRWSVWARNVSDSNDFKTESIKVLALIIVVLLVWIAWISKGRWIIG